jgi:probable rRNA maturation factor
MNTVVSVDLQVASSVGSVPDESLVQSWVQDVINEMGIRRECEVSIRIVDEQEGHALNLQYRDKDSATNVLSFPVDDQAMLNLPADVPRVLGDIVICGPIVEREAKEQNKQIEFHWAHLLVHGTLHLLGHDHEEDAQAEEMEAIETRILGKRGVADPYIASNCTLENGTDQPS